MRRLVKVETNAEQPIGIRRRGERGQVAVLFILIIVTSMLIAIVAVSVGQVLVRRQHAQMVVDAAALAGAGSQARGLNTIATLNKASYTMLQMIWISSLLPYDDSSSTTEARFWEHIFTGPLYVLYTSDWAGTILEDYQQLFDIMNTLTDLVNTAFMPLNPMGFAPNGEAKKVVNANFSDDGDTIFKSADLDGSGTGTLGLKLVKLTDPEDYKIGGHYYAPYPLHWSLKTCQLPFPADIPCANTVAAYLELTAFDLAFKSTKYQLGKFYDNDEGDDVRFCYYLKVSQSPVLFGKNFFDDIPPITVAAAAKPYGGYLGTKFQKGFLGFSQQSGKEISATYKPKLVPLTAKERILCSVMSGDVAHEDQWLLDVIH
jgi:Putative Flp pilus-assembly TadE/G-like